MVSLYTEHMGDMLCAEGFALLGASFIMAMPSSIIRSKFIIAMSHYNLDYIHVHAQCTAVAVHTKSYL